MNKHDKNSTEIYLKEIKPQMSAFKMALITFSVFVVMFSIAGMVEA